jgi:multidrug efflux pump subunit AcrA (membrane-fusion protein)
MAASNLLLLAALLGADSGESIEIPSAIIKVAEEAAVPAGEAGLLAEIGVKDGQLVDEGELIARIRDSDVRLLVERSRIEAEIARKKSTSELDIQYAKKSTQVARAELARSLDSNAKYPKTVSSSELDRQRLLVEQGELETQKAEHEREVAALMLEIRENEHRTALEQLERRTIASPLKGMVVDVQRRRGEWVQPGDTIARIVRLDRLRVEGFLAAKHARLDLTGNKVRIKVEAADGAILEAAGEIVFVSPEIDPINAQVRVWAEIDNADLALRPGMQATVLVEPE